MSKIKLTTIIILLSVLNALVIATPVSAEIDRLDTSFNGVGYVTHHGAAGGNGSEIGYAMVMQDDGKYVVGGFGPNALGNDDIIIWRYNSDGTLDTNFSGDGIFTKNFSTSGNLNDRIAGYSGISIDSNGKIIFTGYVKIAYTNADMLLGRLNSDGTLDTTFNSVGFVSYPSSTGDDQGFSIIEDSFGKYIVTGYIRSPVGSDDMAIWRYNHDGSIDTTFNGTGVVKHNNAAGGNGIDSGNSIILDEDKYIVAGHSTGVTSIYDLAIWRYLSNGILDTTFNNVGYLTHNSAAGGNSFDTAHSLLTDNQGKYVAAGMSRNISGNNDIAIWRMNNDGSLDSTFNNVGFAIHHNAAGGNGSDVAFSLALQPDGKYLITGYSTNPSNFDMAIWRYNTDGTIDTTFNSVGYLFHNGAAGGSGHSLKIQPDGKYVIAGFSNNASGNLDMALWRYEILYQIDSASMLPQEGGLDVSIGSENGAAGNDVLISLNKNSIPLADVLVDIWHDLDWNGVSGDIDTVNFKSFVNGLAEADGVQGTFSLFIPRKSGDQAVGICPGAVTLDDVNTECSNISYKSINDSDVEAVEINGVEYFKVSGLTGTGGFSIEDLPLTGQRIKVPLIIGGGIIFISIWIFLTRKVYKLRTKK